MENPTSETPKKRGRGRPKGSKNKSVTTAEVHLSRCPKCQSTDREPYWKKHEIATSGTTPAGHAYNVVVLKWTRCLNCQQVRIDRIQEMRAV